MVVIDEPEVGLDPDTQIRLAKELFTASFKKQIIFTTHSENLFEWEWFDQGFKIFKFTKNPLTSIHSPTESTLASITGLLKDRKKPFLLDAETKRLVFRKNALIMEGQEDVGILRSYCRFHNLDYQDIKLPFLGYGAGGKDNIAVFLRLCSELGISAYAIYDAEAKVEMIKAKEEFKENSSINIDNISTYDIRDKRSDIIGLADESGVIKEGSKTEVNGIIDKIKIFFNL